MCRGRPEHTIGACNRQTKTPSPLRSAPRQRESPCSWAPAWRACSPSPPWAVGALAFWGDDQKDDQGDLTTDSQPFAASTHALATENLDLDLDGAETLIDETSLGDILLDVASQTGKPVFVGIARTDDVSANLADVSHTTVTDLDYEPFGASYEPQAGSASPARPGAQGFWAHPRRVPAPRACAGRPRTAIGRSW